MIEQQLYKGTAGPSPIVKISYVSKCGKTAEGLVILDSCCSDNALSSTFADAAGVSFTEEGTEIYTLGDQMVAAKVGQFNFSIGEESFSEKFNIQKDTIFDYPIIGILGNVFMQKCNLVIDYASRCVHNHPVTPATLRIADCNFFFPMQIGLVNYGIPVVAMVDRNGKARVMMTDSGSTNNVITQDALVKSGFSFEKTGEKDTLTTIAGVSDSEIVIMDFNLVSSSESEAGTKNLFYRDVFQMVDLPYILSGHCSEDGIEDPLGQDIDGVIGSAFMEKQCWVLDFGAKLVYQRR